jgi:hypothetical protein
VGVWGRNFSGVGQKTFKKFQKFQLCFKHFFTFRSKHQKNAFQRILRRRKNFALHKPSPGLCQNLHIFQTCSKSQRVMPKSELAHSFYNALFNISCSSQRDSSLLEGACVHATPSRVTNALLVWCWGGKKFTVWSEVAHSVYNAHPNISCASQSDS